MKNSQHFVEYVDFLLNGLWQLMTFLFVFAKVDSWQCVRLTCQSPSCWTDSGILSCYPPLTEINLLVLFSQSATALANSTAIQELFKRTLVGVRLLRSGFEVTSLMSVCNFSVLSHVQETCILALVRNTCSMFRLDMILIDVGCYKVYWRRHGCYGVHGGWE